VIDATLDALSDIAENLWRHRVRTLLTTLSVAWGTFVLVVLLGAGQGLQNSVAHQFRDDATNSIWIYRGQTTLPFLGHPVGREVRFDVDDVAMIDHQRGVEHLTARYYPGRSALLAYSDRSGSFSIRSVHPDHRYLEGSVITRGRFLSDLDLERRRKVVVLSEEIAEFLFRGADPIGEYVLVNRVPFRVVGLYFDDGSDREMRNLYVPLTTAQATFGGGTREVDQIMFTIHDATLAEAARLEDRARRLLSDAHDVDPDDRSAIRVRNNVERFQRVQQIFDLLEAFVWLVGLGTTTAGIVGVSNIMLVSVRERTAEIGLRKALGARPGQILGAIVTEAVLLTATSGYVGIVGGVAVIELVRASLPPNDYLREPEVTLLPAVIAAGALVLFGALAGLVPAWQAARVHPVDALRDAA